MLLVLLLVVALLRYVWQHMLRYPQPRASRRSEGAATGEDPGREARQRCSLNNSHKHVPSPDDVPKEPAAHAEDAVKDVGYVLEATPTELPFRHHADEEVAGSQRSQRIHRGRGCKRAASLSGARGTHAVVHVDGKASPPYSTPAKNPQARGRKASASPHEANASLPRHMQKKRRATTSDGIATPLSPVMHLRRMPPRYTKLFT